MNNFERVGPISWQPVYISQQFLGICPGDKVPTSENPLLCRCPAGSIQALSDRCAMCKVGEVPNEDQTACVGMFEKLTEICLMTFCFDKVGRQYIMNKFVWN